MPISRQVQCLVEPVQRERNFITLLARLDESNRAIVDLHVFPNIDRPKKFQISDTWMTRGKRLIDLSRLCEVVMQVHCAKGANLGSDLTSGLDLSNHQLSHDVIVRHWS